MKLIKDKILSEGDVLPGNILKVGSFLNHRVDAGFIMQLGEEIARRFRTDNPTMVLTIETSGIVIAMATAVSLGVPMVFAKKNRSGNLSGDLFVSVVHSYTHNTDYSVVVEKQYISPDDRVLIVDDFLANGKAVEGLLDIIEQAGATPVGACAAIEKGFQPGGERLRSHGLHVESLALVDDMSDGIIKFRS